MDLHEVTETLPVDPGQEYRRCGRDLRKRRFLASGTAHTVHTAFEEHYKNNGTGLARTGHSRSTTYVWTECTTTCCVVEEGRSR